MAAVSRMKFSANYIFKQRYGRFFLYSVLVSLFAHIVFIIYTPKLGAEIKLREESTMESVDLPPEVVIPPPPKDLAKPSIPMEATEEIDEDITIEETTPPPPDLIPEVPVEEDKVEVVEFLMVAEVMPKVKFRPPLPKIPSYIARARVDVWTKVHFFVLKDGSVDPQRTRVSESSGYPELDDIATEWTKQWTFYPAMNRGEPVAVQVVLPIQWVSK